GTASPPSAAAVPNTKPSAPLAPGVNASGGNISVSFTAPFDGGSTITNYTVSCPSSDGGVTGDATGAVSPIVVSGVTAGKTYSCTVFATNANGDGPVSPASVNIVPGGHPNAPAKPGAAPGNGRITVSFVPPADGGSPITDYAASCGGAGLTTRVIHGSA